MGKFWEYWWYFNCGLKYGNGAKQQCGALILITNLILKKQMTKHRLRIFFFTMNITSSIDGHAEMKRTQN